MPDHDSYYHPRPPRISDAEHHRRVRLLLARMTPEQQRRTLQAAAFGTVKDDQPLLPFAAVPVVLKQYGIAEAHSRPLVGRRLEDDSIRSWRTSPPRAWLHPLVEWTRTGCSYVALAFDLDDRIALEHVAAANIGSHEIPCPNIVVYRKQTGHAHAVYTLRRPVFRGEKARPFPLAVLARCSEWLIGALHADAGFTGVLVSNPTHQDYEPVWLRPKAYTLDQLREYIPAGWRRPRIPRTDVGRNCDLFRALMRFAGVATHSNDDVEQYAHQLYNALDVDHPHTYTSAELAGTIKSVLRYRRKWQKDGWNRPAFAAHQAEAGAKNTSEQQQIKGIRSGEARRDRTRERDERILEHLDEGLSTRQVAHLEGLTHPRIVQLRQRIEGGKRTTTQVVVAALPRVGFFLESRY